jgi:hypothetical protein
MQYTGIKYMYAFVATGGEQVTPAIAGRSNQLLYQLYIDSHRELLFKNEGASDTISFELFIQWLYLHFASAYKQVIGFDAPKQVIQCRHRCMYIVQYI